MALVGSENSRADFSSGDLVKGKALHELKCAKCHKLYEPSDYDNEEWDRWMGKMRKKAHLNSENDRLITGYLDSLRKK